MASPFNIVDAPRTINTTIDQLYHEILHANSGAIINVTVAGDPLHLDMSGVKKLGYGVVVKLPDDQKIRLTASGCENIHFIGGRFSTQEVSGVFDGAFYGASLKDGTKVISIRGATLTFSANNVLASGTQDLIITDCTFSDAKADHLHAPGVTRLLFQNNDITSGMKGPKTCVFTDGREPVEGMNATDCTNAGGVNFDMPHNDVVQFVDTCNDVTLIGNTSDAYVSQGIFANFLHQINRAHVEDNTLNDTSIQGIVLPGTDITVIGNHVSGASSISGRINIERKPAEGSRVRGGQNTADAIFNPPGVDLASGTINGDEGVVTPELPRIVFPPWAPEPVKPAPEPLTVPIYGALGQVYPAGPVTVGDYLTGVSGIWRGYGGATFERQWRSGSGESATPIEGATGRVYQPDAAGEVSYWMRGTNSQGVGNWHQIGASVTVNAA